MGWFLIAGMAAGFLAIGHTIKTKRHGLGAPTQRQRTVLYLAIAFEIAALILFGFSGYFQHHSSLEVWQAGLAIVAVHFLIMHWSHGYLISLLGITLLAWLAVCVLADISFLPMMVGDGLLKTLFGLVMALPLLTPAEIPCRN